jgi:hypothetical protein
MAWWAMRGARWVVCGAAAAVALLDLAQVALLDWRPKHWGSLGGAALYAVIAAGAARDAAWADLLAVLIPLIPLSVLTATLLGASLPVVPDREMVGILMFQLVAAGAGALRLLARRRAAKDRSG